MINIYKNQYIVTEHSSDCNYPAGFLEESIGSYSVFYDRNLNVSVRKLERSEIVLLGFIIDPLSPNLSNSEILDHLIREVKNNPDNLLKEIQKFSGRFVILYNCNNSLIAFNDCCGLRQIYFNSDGPFTMSSSPELILSTLGYTFQMSNTLTSLFNNKHFIKKEFPWYKETWYDPRIKKVLPNHFLKINDRSVNRIEYYFTGPDNQNDILDFAKSVLTGSLDAIHKRDEVIQPITAGWDTRILLAASRELADKTKYYLFDNPDEKFVDRIVATNLSKKLGFEFSLIEPDPLKEEFADTFKKRFAVPRILEKTAHIQWHYYNSQKSGIININGNGGEVARCYYNSKTRNGTIDDITTITGFSSIFKNDIAEWISESRTFSDTSGIGNLDLFYWEHRMGNWGSMFPFEQDIAIEEFSPFNNKNLLYSILKIKSSDRRPPDYKFFRELILHLWPETLIEPINPVLGLSLEWRLKKLMKSSPVILNVVRKFKGMN
jgi:hypothetical protein